MSTRERSNREDCLYAVISEIASREETDPTDLPPLARSIDTDALETLLDSSNSNFLVVTFDYLDYTVTVRNDGSVAVEPTDYSECDA